jgi:hypothetical protein
MGSKNIPLSLQLVNVEHPTFSIILSLYNVSVQNRNYVVAVLNRDEKCEDCS